MRFSLLNEFDELRPVTSSHCSYELFCDTINCRISLYIYCRKEGILHSSAGKCFPRFRISNLVYFSEVVAHAQQRKPMIDAASGFTWSCHQLQPQLQPERHLFELVSSQT